MIDCFHCVWYPADCLSLKLLYVLWCPTLIPVPILEL